MQRNYPYRGFVINVSLEGYGSPSLENWRLCASGYVAVITVFKEGYSPAIIGPLRLMDTNDSWFPTEAEALLAGGSEGQRAVDRWLTGGRE